MRKDKEMIQKPDEFFPKKNAVREILGIIWYLSDKSSQSTDKDVYGIL